MLVGVFPSQDGMVEIDFSWIYDEMKNLKDVPREFDEEFLRSVGISNAVIAYWKETGFSPGYYQRYILKNRAGRRSMTYGQYKEWCLGILPYIRQENERIADAIAAYLEAEDKALEWFQTSTDGYIYELSECDTEDDSEDTIFMSNSWENIYRLMKEAASECSYPNVTEYEVCRYGYTNKDGIIDVHYDEYKGRIRFDHELGIISSDDIDRFQYGYESVSALTTPFIVLPAPFKKGDFVKFGYGDGTVQHGVWYGTCTQEDFDRMRQKGFTPDGSDMNVNVRFFFRDDEDGMLYNGHDHVFPYELEYSDLSEDDKEYKNLLDMKEHIIKEEPDWLKEG